MDTCSWHLADQAISSKGQKSCQLTANHKPVTFQLGDGLRTRFGATNFEKVDLPRRNLDFDLDEPTHEKLKEIDQWAISYITEHSERLLKKKLSHSEVENAYTPLVRTYGSCSSVKTKINIRGPRAATYWDCHGGQIHEPPEEGTWQQFSYCVAVAIPQLWIMQGSFGLLLETTALALCAPAAVNPFLKS